MTVARDRWLRGTCPCCGQPLDNDGIDGSGPATIGEGVMVCGWCVERRHHVGDLVGVILAEILEPA